MNEQILSIIDKYSPEIAVILIKELLSDESEDLKEGKIVRILNVFENGSIERNYSGVFVFNDGPNSIKQLTYSIGFTEFGNLPKVVEEYASAPGEFSEEFKKYVGRVGQPPSLHSSTEFKRLLKEAGSDLVMREIQDKIFAEKYLGPAKKFFEENKFTLPLSLLVIADSYLHSGSVLTFLRKRFKETPPLNGGDEKEWIKQYVNARHQWLSTHSRSILRKTIYRTNCFKEQISSDNWNLIGPVNANGIIVN